MLDFDGALEVLQRLLGAEVEVSIRPAMQHAERVAVLRGTLVRGRTETVERVGLSEPDSLMFFNVAHRPGDESGAFIMQRLSFDKAFWTGLALGESPLLLVLVRGAEIR